MGFFSSESDSSPQVCFNAGMALLDVRILPDNVLRSPTEEVEAFDSKLHGLLDDMFETMLAEHGLGLAAPQVGILKRIAVIDLSVESMPQPTITSLSGHKPEEHTHGNRLEIINPILEKEGKIVPSSEGCLSIPDFRETIKRHDTVSVTAHDRLGRAFKIRAAELLAFALQHEIDHLHGVLFVDYLTGLKKQLFQRWYNKNLAPLS
jgi:peptide deformylase